MTCEKELKAEIELLRQQIKEYKEYIKIADNPYTSYEEMLILCGYERRLAKLLPSPYIAPNPIL